MANSLVVKTYQQVGFSLEVPFTSEGYFNATKAARAFGTTPKDWLRTQDAQKYIDAIRRKCLIEENQLVRVVSGAPETGGGTWMHPKLGIVFARWLNVDFALWCDDQIEAILHGQPPQPTQPTPTEYLTVNDQGNIQRLIWSIAHHLRYESGMSSAVWYALRRATGCPSPNRFELRHLPIIAAELRRILEIAAAYQNHQYTMECELIKRAIRSREIPSIVIGRLKAIENEWLSDSTKWQAKLGGLHLNDLDALALRRPAGCDHSPYAEPALV